MIWKAIALALWLGPVLLSLLPRRVASVRSGLYYYGFCSYAGFPCHRPNLPSPDCNGKQDER